MQRRAFLAAASAAAVPAAWAHHGWSSFDQDRPIYLEGIARKVAWRNPHAEFDLELLPDLKLPADLAKRPVPAQSAGVDGAKLFGAAVLPTRKDKVWHIELAPISRMNAWQVAELKEGDRVAMVGFAFAGEKGEPVLRVEYLIVGAKTYGLRSSPA
jgi:hypothetical protein